MVTTPRTTRMLMAFSDVPAVGHLCGCLGSSLTRCLPRIGDGQASILLQSMAMTACPMCATVAMQLQVRCELVRWTILGLVQPEKYAVRDAASTWVTTSTMQQTARTIIA